MVVESRKIQTRLIEFVPDLTWIALIQLTMD
jgi:hypothetical protein